MKSISKLKDEARKYEQREEWEKAIQAYLQVLKIADEEETEVELPLYNRLGDLCVRLGRPEDAVRHYEQAADRYAEAGLYNNAIALCNKALRYNRDRLELIRKLGQFSALQGFITDARRYFLDYAERQFNAGRVDEALNALEDFADVSDDAEVREMLGRRMLAHGRTAGAMNALQRAYTMRLQAGETDRAEALRAELQAMDPNGAVAAGPAAGARPAQAPVEELPKLAEPGPDIEVAAFEDPGTAPVEGLQPAEPDASLDASSFEITGLDATSEPLDIDATAAAAIDGLETGTVDFSEIDADEAEDLGLIREETSFGGDMFPESGPESSGESFDLPLLGDDPKEEATPIRTPEIDIAPIDLGSDFSFDFGGFGTTETAAATPAETLGPDTISAGDLDLPRAGADDDGIDLATDGVDDDGIDHVGTGGADDDGIALGDADDDAFDLPTLDDAPFELPTLDAGDDAQETATTFDGATELDSAPPAWEPEPKPTFDLPTYEPEPTYEAIEPESASSIDLPGLDEPGPIEVPEVEVPLEPQALESHHDVGPAPEIAAADDSLQIPAIELPTWDTEPAPPDADGVGVEDREIAAFGDEPVAAGGGEPAAADTTTDDWLDAIADEPAAVDDRVAAPEPPPPAEPPAPAVEDIAERERRANDAARERAARAPAPTDGDGFIDLGALITEDDDQATTRFRIQETAPTGDEDRDFAELLSQFKSKVHEHLPPEDATAHYDLGLAFKEMGLVDEAIGEFQIALRAGEMRLRVYEELGQCFLMKEQYNIAEKVLTRALAMKFDDELELLGVYYHLGRALEALGRRDQARDAYERVLGMDINFEDVTARLARL